MKEGGMLHRCVGVKSGWVLWFEKNTVFVCDEVASVLNQSQCKML